jgi:hypothetical protein
MYSNNVINIASLKNRLDRFHEMFQVQSQLERPFNNCYQQKKTNKQQIYPTNCMQLNPSWEAGSSAANQERLNVSRNPKFHYCAHKSPPQFSILNQINPIHNILFYLSTLHFNIVQTPFTSP